MEILKQLDLVQHILKPIRSKKKLTVQRCSKCPKTKGDTMMHVNTYATKTSSIPWH